MRHSRGNPKHANLSATSDTIERVRRPSRTQPDQSNSAAGSPAVTWVDGPVDKIRALGARDRGSTPRRPICSQQGRCQTLLSFGTHPAGAWSNGKTPASRADDGCSSRSAPIRGSQAGNGDGFRTRSEGFRGFESLPRYPSGPVAQRGESDVLARREPPVRIRPGPSRRCWVIRLPACLESRIPSASSGTLGSNPSGGVGSTVRDEGR